MQFITVSIVDYEDGKGTEVFEAEICRDYSKCNCANEIEHCEICHMPKKMHDDIEHFLYKYEREGFNNVTNQ